MNRMTQVIAAAALFTGATIALAGDGYPMKCMKDDKGKGGCGYEEMVTFGGGMFFEQITGYCKGCDKFVHLSWTRENLPEGVGPAKVTPKPKPLGEIWNANTGALSAVYACPHCKGPFVAINSVKELKHCPKCNGANFKIDPSKPRLAID